MITFKRLVEISFAPRLKRKTPSSKQLRDDPNLFRHYRDHRDEYEHPLEYKKDEDAKRKSFKKFVNEEVSKTDKLKHLEHPEDHMINHGASGFDHAISTLKGVHHALIGGKSDVPITVKKDGSPGITFGHNPENGKFFVATKSLFNKMPKVNYSHEDIEKNHGHAPGLVSKLKDAFDHLPKVTPKTGVYAGDIMHTPDMVHSNDTHVSFTPNTITYSAKKDSKEGKKVQQSKLGVAVHTKYSGDNLNNITAVHGTKDIHKEFGNHNDVNVIPVSHDYSRAKIDNTAFNHHIRAAKKYHTALGREETDNISNKHQKYLNTYINSTVRHGMLPSASGLGVHVYNKAPKTKRHDLANEVTKNAKNIDTFLKAHHHIQQAKNTLVNALNKTKHPYSHSINNNPTNPEGYVATYGGKPTKLVNRGEFSRQNFAKHNE